MKIVVIRHGKVEYTWSRWCTSEEFDKACMAYDRAPVRHSAYPVPAAGSDNVFISSLPRSRETAAALYRSSPRQAEGRRGTQARARNMVDLLCREGADAAIVTHGFYMITLLREMKHAGFRISKSHLNYQNGEYVIAEKNE